MTHGDDDGLRLPPAIAPRQVVIVPMLRDKPEDAEVLAYCEALAKALARDDRARRAACARCSTPSGQRSADKRWDWVRRGAPIIVEIGPRDAAAGQVTFMRRDQLRDGEKIASRSPCRATISSPASPAPAGRDPGRRSSPRPRRGWTPTSAPTSRASTRSPTISAPAADDEDEGCAFKGWVRAPWSRPTGAALDAVEARLKTLKLTLRNIPLDQSGVSGQCLFTGEPAVEDVLIARAY